MLHRCVMKLAYRWLLCAKHHHVTMIFINNYYCVFYFDICFILSFNMYVFNYFILIILSFNNLICVYLMCRNSL